MSNAHATGGGGRKGGKQMSLKVRMNAVSLLLWMATGTTLPHGAIIAVARESNVSEGAIRKIWKRLASGETPSSMIILKKTGNKNCLVYHFL